GTTTRGPREPAERAGNRPRARRIRPARPGVVSVGGDAWALEHEYRHAGALLAALGVMPRRPDVPQGGTVPARGVVGGRLRRAI
ncbi:MAG: hypothetical protein AVDCRST_MAG69-759, partial [uncultured Solirubrobacteraceae bacterium]